MTEELHTPEEWFKLKNLKFFIIDPDGWRTDDAPGWNEPISEADFNWRLSRCTLGGLL